MAAVSISTGIAKVAPQPVGGARLAVRGYKRAAVIVKRQALDVPGGVAGAEDDGTYLGEDLAYDASAAEVPAEVEVNPYAVSGYPPEVLADPAVQAAISAAAASLGYPPVGGAVNGAGAMEPTSFLDIEAADPTPTIGRGSTNDVKNAGVLDDEDEEMEDELDSTISKGRGATSTSLSGTGISRTSGKNSSSTLDDEEEEEEEEDIGAGMKLSSKAGWTLLAAIGASYFVFDGVF
ncbi:hypothetical protein P389DRAFT_110435 [Cystobasidium minutum MCA 4210]|uniref:uncharacterized protein n=1 Tax=Cystobasidium minutum MCA 4210 TaxID=1397322 RepID=UPI0034CDDDD8|eukprot:jgi/Rhomi1/110435/CE110434_103